MIKYLLCLLLILPASTILAQEKKWLLSANAEFNVPTYKDMSGAGYGASLNLERVYNRKISGILTVAYDAFNQSVYDPFKQQTLHGFSLLPVLIGVRYYAGSVFYASGQAGAPACLHSMKTYS